VFSAVLAPLLAKFALANAAPANKSECSNQQPGGLTAS
jgi:hypothetical protein